MSPKDLKPGMVIVERNGYKITDVIKVQVVAPCTQPGATHVNMTKCYYDCADLEVRI